MESEWEDEIDDAYEEGDMKSLWNIYYDLEDRLLLRKYPETSPTTIFKAYETLDSYLWQERIGMPLMGGGKEDQPEEWVIGLQTAYTAKAKADEDNEVAKAANELTKDSDEKEIGSGRGQMTFDEVD